MKDLFIKMGVTVPGAVSITTMIENSHSIMQLLALMASIAFGTVLFILEYRNKRLTEKKLKEEIQRLENQ